MNEKFKITHNIVRAFGSVNKLRNVGVNELGLVYHQRRIISNYDGFEASIGQAASATAATAPGLETKSFSTAAATAGSSISPPPAFVARAITLTLTLSSALDVHNLSGELDFIFNT